MIECMRSMKENYKDEDKTLGSDYDFFERYLLPYYENNNEEEKLLDVASETLEIFYNLIGEYNNSKDKCSTDKNTTEQEADSLAFYISTGLIIRSEDGGFKINSSLLNKTGDSFQNALEKAKAYSIGAM